MTRRIPLVLVLALAAVAGLVAPASARWWGNNGWYEDNRWAGDRWYGYNYRPPPVVYGTGMLETVNGSAGFGLMSYLTVPV